MCSSKHHAGTMTSHALPAVAHAYVFFWQAAIRARGGSRRERQRSQSQAHGAETRARRRSSLATRFSGLLPILQAQGAPATPRDPAGQHDAAGAAVLSQVDQSATDRPVPAAAAGDPPGQSMTHAGAARVPPPPPPPHTGAPLLGSLRMSAPPAARVRSIRVAQARRVRDTSNSHGEGVAAAPTEPGHGSAPSVGIGLQ
jgi:hypothetical protein